MRGFEMTILIDGDACPVTGIVKRIAKENQIPLIILCDTSHIITSDYGEVVTVSKGADAVDFALMNRTKKGDIVVTQDYGVAAMILGKGAYGIHQSGKWYTNQNIEQMLLERHIAKKVRRSSNRYHAKAIKKRTIEDDKRFEESFLKLLEKAKNKT